MSDEDLYVVPYAPEDETFTTVDWKAGPYEVLHTVSGLLRAHGLVVLLADSSSDQCPFKIARRYPPDPAKAPEPRGPFIGLPLGNGDWV